MSGRSWSNRAGDRSFHLLKGICLIYFFPLVGLKGSYNYWKYVHFFQGSQPNGRKERRVVGFTLHPFHMEPDTVPCRTNGLQGPLCQVPCSEGTPLVGFKSLVGCLFRCCCSFVPPVLLQSFLVGAATYPVVCKHAPRVVQFTLPNAAFVVAAPGKTVSPWDPCQVP